MFADDGFTFSLCVSQKGYGTKPTKEQVPTLSFEPRNLTIDDALQCALEGRAFCYSFFTSNEKGTISLKDKKESNFLSTSTIIYDFDDMDVQMHDYIETLQFKPSFAYPTYSDGKNGYNRFRLAYVFDNAIWGVQDFNSMCQSIAAANEFVKEGNGHGGWDKRNVSQLYFGTRPGASTYNSHKIYNEADFRPYMTYSTEPPKVLPRSRTDYTKYQTSLDPEFLRDFTHLQQTELYKKYRDVYYQNYEPSLSTPLILDESEMFFIYPNDYVCVTHKRKGKYTLRWDIGKDRKKKMYITAQIMLFNLPTLSLENLLYNLSIERQWYYDNRDGKISNEFLIQTAINAYNKPYPLKPSKHGKFKLNKAFWSEQRLTANQAKMVVRGVLKRRDVNRLYDPQLSIRENYRMLQEKGVKISLRTLERIVTDGDIKIITQETPHTYLSCCPDCVTIQILDLIRDNERITQSEIAVALSLSTRTVKRYMKEMEGRYIVREGNNRSGYWRVLQPWEVGTSTVDCSINSR